MNMYLIVFEGNYSAIDTDDSSCHGYYIMKFYSSLYKLQTDLSMNSQVVSSVKII